MASMDPKILAAVFASIAAIAVGSGGGSLGNMQNFTDGDIMNGITLPSSDILDKLREKPEPTENVSVKATMSSNQSSLELEGGTLKVSRFEEMRSGDRSLESNSELHFKEFKGSIVLRKSNNTLLKGKTGGFSSRGVNLSQKFNLGFETDAEKITVTHVERKNVLIRNVDVEMVSSEGTEISGEDTKLDINSFTGKVEVNPYTGEIMIEGKVDRLKAGGTVFKG